MFELISEQPFPRSLEFIEKKGRGHPDSLADALAEIISYTYAAYCIENFGAVLHHYVDKLTLLGGEARATPGRYTQVRKFRILLNGRFSRSFGGQEIPVFDIAREAVRNYLPLVLPLVEDNHWEIVDNTNPSSGSSAKGWHWWAPRGLADLPDVKLRRANDTSLSVANAPHTPLEAAVLKAEHALFDQLCLTGRTGSDVKILASRTGSRLEATACVPVLASAVASRSNYDSIKDRTRDLLASIFQEVPDIDEFELHLNTRDDVAAGDIYLLGLGTALEHGDEGVVGRGNRSNGLISTGSPMSLDAPWGKNPVYFTGRVYDGCARAASNGIWTQVGIPNSVYLASQNGRPLTDPWRAVVRTPPTDETVKQRVISIATEAFSNALRLEFQLDDIRSRHPHLPVVKTS
ncbi:methionine adenosyltransferase [Actinoalloteichus spitiensis]|uniref:methionine adenosyltransferase n=1 Tax=Actinoalloteichus spitiensis TaxID=252394 RepID=UPI0012F6C4F0|nr:methionine adenosyltransferase [Actinoalloteichus spitiensis]